MKKPSSYITFILLSSPIIFSSCGGGNSVAKISIGTSALVSEERVLTNEERIIATRICYAYQSKSKNFRGSDLDSQFNFSTQYTDCQNQTSQDKITTKMNYGPGSVLMYNPTSSIRTTLPFYKRVQTDSSGLLSLLCSKIKNNEVINNTIEEEKYKIQISFSREDLDAFTLQYFSKIDDGSFKIESVDKFKVRTQIDYHNGQILGMDESYSTEKACSEANAKKKASLYEQNFVSR